MKLEDVKDAMEYLKQNRYKTTKYTGYKINNVLSEKIQEIQELTKDVNELIRDVGRCEILALISVLLDDEYPIKEIRKAIDTKVSELNLDVIELYCELKSKMKGDMK